MPLARNRYQLADVLYEDGTVIAYRAQDTLLNRPVVVETVAPGNTDPRVGDQLMQKAQQAVRINLPHVAALFNQYAQDDQPFLVWEDIVGEPVADLAPLPPNQAAEVIGVVAETARAALERRLPLPPLLANNVYLGPGGQVHITNLGLHQGASSNAQAAVALGYLLDQMLGDAGAPTSLHTLADQAMSGQIPTVEAFVANLRRVRQQFGATTVAAPRAAAQTPRVAAAATPTPRDMQTVDLSAAPTVREPAGPVGPVPRQVSYSAPTTPMRANQFGAQRRAPSSLPPRPDLQERRSSWGCLWALLTVGALALVAFFLVPPLLSGFGDPATTADATATPTDEGSPEPEESPDEVVVASPTPSPSPSPEATPAPSPSPEPAGDLYVVATSTGQNLVVRDGPGTSSQRITTLPNGTVVEVIGPGQEQDGYTWVPIRIDDVEGWSILEGLEQQTAAASPPPAQPTPAPQPTPEPTAAPTPEPTPVPAEPVPDGPGQRAVVATITGQQLVVRSGPGTSTARVGSLPNGTVVEIVGPAQSVGGRPWVPIRGGGLEGWVVEGGLRRQ